jgi:hypothetical protein
MDVAFDFAPGRLRYNGERFKVVIAFFNNQGRAVKLGDCTRVASDETGEVALRTLQALAQAVGASLSGDEAREHAAAFRAQCREAIRWRPAGAIKRDIPLRLRPGLNRGRVNL